MGRSSMRRVAGADVPLDQVRHDLELELAAVGALKVDVLDERHRGRGGAEDVAALRDVAELGLDGGGPGSAFTSDPRSGTDVVVPDEPPVSETASTMPPMTSTTATAAAIRTGGEARRSRGAEPLAGGGGVRRCCLLRLPLGIG